MTIHTGILSVLTIVLLAAPLSAQRHSDIITAQEIADVSDRAANAYDVIELLRPRWLKVRDSYITGDPSYPVQSEGAHVYLNNVDQGDAAYLKTIPVELIVELRWLSATAAGARFGPTNGPGIVVTVKVPDSR